MKNRKDRLDGIISTLMIENSTSLELLASKFGVSTATIRRDVKLLESSGQVFQTIGGGVVFNREYHGPSREDRLSAQINEKIRIAEFCSTMICEHDTVMIGPGVITSLAGRIFGGLDLRFRLITNSLPLALELSVLENINCHLLGGEVKDESTEKAHGCDPLNGIQYADKLFLTADGIDLEYGLTYFGSGMLPMLKGMMAVAREIILIADSTKFGNVCFSFLDKLSSVTTVVTDDNVKKNHVKSISGCGIELITV